MWFRLLACLHGNGDTRFSLVCDHDGLAIWSCRVGSSLPRICGASKREGEKWRLREARLSRPPRERIWGGLIEGPSDLLEVEIGAVALRHGKCRCQLAPLYYASWVMGHVPWWRHNVCNVRPFLLKGTWYVKDIFLIIVYGFFVMCFAHEPQPLFICNLKSFSNLPTVPLNSKPINSTRRYFNPMLSRVYLDDAVLAVPEATYSERDDKRGNSEQRKRREYLVRSTNKPRG